MKKTQQKDAVRNIKKRIVSYLSICLVVALGLGGLFTTRYMEAGLEKQASGWYDEHNFKDIDMVSSYGISEANLEKIRSVEGVTDAEGVLQADGSVTFGGEKRSAAIISLTERVSVPDVAEGRLPEGTDECMIGEDFAEVEGISVGDKVRISITGLAAVKEQLAGQISVSSDADEDEEAGAGEADELDLGLDDADDQADEDQDPLYSKEFTVTGLMHHPDYLRRKSVNTVSLPLSAFNTEVTEGLFTRCFVRITQPEAGMFDEKYFDQTEATRKTLEECAEELEVDRTEEVKDEAYRTIDEEWAKAEARLAEAQSQIDAGEAELNSQLASGRNKLNNAQKKLDKKVAQYEKKIAKAEKKIKDAEEELAKYKKLLDMLDRNLPKIEEYLAQLKELYKGDLDEAIQMVNTIQSLLDRLDQIVDRSSDTYKAIVRDIAQLIVDRQDLIRRIQSAFADPAAMEAAEKLRDVTGGDIDLTANVARIRDFKVEAMIAAAQEIVDGGGDIDVYLDYVRSYIKELQTFIDAINEAEKYIGWYKDGTLRKMLSDKEAELAAAKKEVKDGKKKLAAEKKKYQKQIDDGWAKYYSEKARYEGKLAEAIELLATNREKAEAKLAEAKAEVENIDQCEWIVLDRKGNAGFVDMNTNLSSIESMGVVFGILFTVITAIVCFSTLVIIIDEQKTLVGTSKAFGFFRREVLGKYLVFGVSAAVAGAILAMLAALGLSDFVQLRFAGSGMYPIGVAKSIVTPVPTILFSLLIIGITVAATVIACTDILRSPASLLMKGAVLRKEKKNRPAKKTASKGGTLYSRLIIRNMIQDKARVIVTIAIIAFSCMLIGLGISLKLAYDGMMNRQADVVNRYDFRMDMSRDVSDEDEAELVAVLEKYGTDFMPATYQSTLYRWNERLDGVNLICANPERFSEFYGITDVKGNDITLPEDGVLIQKRMHESYGMNEGDKLPILDDSLRVHEAEIKGTFVNYVGRTAVLSPAAYKEIFGRVNEANCYFVKLNGADMETVQAELIKASDDISFTTKDGFKVKFEAASKLYNIIVLITTGIAILISFMILTNLANIYLTRKKTELTVMRVNGFTIKEAKGYLSKESIFTTAGGLALGALVGAVLTPLIIRGIQQPDLEFVKSFHTAAWAVAVGLEAVFSLIINTIVYRKVKDLNLKDIA